jgi:hypothetical protein
MTASTSSQTQNHARAGHRRPEARLFDPFEHIFKPRNWTESFAGFADSPTMDASGDGTGGPGKGKNG